MKEIEDREKYFEASFLIKNKFIRDFYKNKKYLGEKN